MHLKHQVGATLQVETKMNVVGQRPLQRVVRRGIGIPRTDDPVDEEQQDGDDDSQFRGEILAHDYFFKGRERFRLLGIGTRGLFISS
jgi:hypothetical protein